LLKQKLVWAFRDADWLYITSVQSWVSVVLFFITLMILPMAIVGADTITTRDPTMTVFLQVMIDTINVSVVLFGFFSILILFITCLARIITRCEHEKQDANMKKTEL
jgi:Na+-transporting methylmalonyl-CoA/oxaloacetate decarboxylase gamma subunit